MKKSEFIKEISKESGIDSAATTKIVDAVFKKIEDKVKSGEKIEIRGFATFSSTARKERKGRNPITGEALIIPAKSYPKIKFHFDFK